MHKTDCIWTEPDRCNCGWLQEIAKNPRRVDDEIERLRAELAVERKRQSAMRTLIASQEGTLSHYRSKQAEADEAVRTLDSERQANATLTAELAECREDAERWRYLRDDGCGFEITVREENEDGYESWVSGYPGAELDAAIDAARKGEGG